MTKKNKDKKFETLISRTNIFSNNSNITNNIML